MTNKDNENTKNVLELKEENQDTNTQIQFDLDNSLINNINNITFIIDKNVNSKNNDNMNNNNVNKLNSNFLITGLDETKNVHKIDKKQLHEEPHYKLLKCNSNTHLQIRDKSSLNILNKVKSATNIITENNRNCEFNHIFPKINTSNTILKLENITERESVEQKRKFLDELRNKELLKAKEYQLKISDLMNNKTKLLSKKNSPLKKVSNNYGNKYLYMDGEEKEKQRKLEEDFYVSLENEKRKLKYSPISSEELNKFSNEVMHKRKILIADLEIKKNQLNSLWKERKKLLPDYKSKFQEMNEKFDNEIKNMEINRQEQIRKEFNNKRNFAEIIYKNFQPKIINDKLKFEREEKIKKLNGIERYNDIKNLGKKLKLISKKIYDSQPKNFKINHKLIIEDNINRKTPLLKPIDYLSKARIINKKKSISPIRNVSCDKIINNENKINNQEDNYKNIQNMKSEAIMLQKKAKEKKLLLKYEKDSGNNDKIDKLNSEISHLYYNCIQAKLNLLNKYNND